MAKDTSFGKLMGTPLKERTVTACVAAIKATGSASLKNGMLKHSVPFWLHDACALQLAIEGEGYFIDDVFHFYTWPGVPP